MFIRRGSNNFRSVLRNLCAKIQQIEGVEVPTYDYPFSLTDSSLLDTVNGYVHQAYERIYPELVRNVEVTGLDIADEDAEKLVASVITSLDSCNNIIEVRYPVKSYDGQFQLIKGIRAHHGLQFQDIPCLGGLRIGNEFDRNDVEALATLSTYRHFCMGIDMAGAYGAIVLPQLHNSSMKEVIQGYTKELALRGFCGNEIDIFEPDGDTGSHEMKWATDAYSDLMGSDRVVCAVGKSIAYGGIENYDKALGQSLFFCADVFLNNNYVMNQIDMESGWNKKTFIIDGLENVGTYTSGYLSEAGAKCIGLRDDNFYIYDQNGIDLDDTLYFKMNNSTIKGYSDKVHHLSDDKSILSQPCDILVLAHADSSLDATNSDKVNAKVIIEAVNGSIVPAAHTTLLKKNKLVLPDILVNGGGSVASYLEYLKNLTDIQENIRLSSTNETFKDIISMSNASKIIKATASGSVSARPNSEQFLLTTTVDAIMEQVCNDVIRTSRIYKLGLDFRTAAYIHGIKRMFYLIYSNSQHMFQ